MDHFFTFDKLDYVSKKKDGSCIFCSLQKAPAKEADLTVLTTERFLMILNLYPYNPGHSMILPKRHVSDIRDLTDTENAELDELRDYIIDMLTALYSPKGFNIGFNMGLPAGASIEHIHMHIIPRYPNEIGIAELLGGKRVLVENPSETCRKMREWSSAHPFSTRII